VSNTPITTAPPASVTLANGTIITSDQTPLERHNAVAKSIGEAPVTPQSRNLFPVTGMTDGTAAELSRRDAWAAAKAAPPSAPAKPAEPTPAEKIAALDSELQAAAIQKTPPTPRAPDGKFIAKATVADVDAGFIDALNRAYRALSPADREAKHSQYMAELAEGYEGRRLGEGRGDFLARTAGNPGSDKPVTAEIVKPAAAPAASDEAATNAALDKATKASNKYGWAPASAITGPLLHGYTLPPGEYHVAELVSGLRDCRAGDLTQQQVNQILARPRNV
jgi:hypothetical protein